MHEHLTQPQEVLLRAGVQHGDVVVDMGCGAGHFTIAAARIVGEAGRAIGVDVARSAVEVVQSAARLEGLDNVEVHRVDVEHAQVPVRDVPVDWVLLRNILHIARDRAAIIAEAARLARGGGRILVVEWRHNVRGHYGPPMQQRLAPERVAALLVRHGVTIVMQPRVVDRWRYMIIGEPECKKQET